MNHLSLILITVGGVSSPTVYHSVMKYVGSLLCATLLACSAEPTSVVENEELVMEFEFKGMSGLYEIDGIWYRGMANTKTYKALHLFDSTGQLAYEVDLKPVCNLTSGIAGIEIISLDTILVLPNYDSVLYMINQSGEIWDSVEFGPYLRSEGIFELRRCATPFKFNDTTMIFNLGYSDLNIPEDKRSHYETFFTESKKAPGLFKVDNIFEDSLTVHFGAAGIYNRFTEPEDVVFDGWIYRFFEQSIVFYSLFSDSLYIFDAASLALNKAVPIKSVYSRIKVTPITVPEFKADPMAINTVRFTDGHICTMAYDPTKQQYYVYANHQPKNGETNWSVFILDDGFTPIKEVKMDASKYISAGMYYPGKGPLVLKRRSEAEMEQAPNRFEYHVFHDIEKNIVP